MGDLARLIGNASADEMSELSLALKKRYGELFPDWEIIIISIEKKRDRNEQIDNMIRRLKALRND